MRVYFDTSEATDDELHTCISHHGGIGTYLLCTGNSRYLTKYKISGNVIVISPIHFVKFAQTKA